MSANADDVGSGLLTSENSHRFPRSRNADAIACRAGADSSGFSRSDLNPSVPVRLRRQLAHRVEQRPRPTGLTLQGLAETNQVPTIPGVELDHPARWELVFGSDQAPLRSLAVRRMRGQVDAEERPLVLA